MIGARGSGKTCAAVSSRAHAQDSVDWYVSYATAWLNAQTTRMDAGLDPLPTNPMETEMLELTSTAGAKRSILITSGEILNPAGASEYERITRPWLQASGAEPIVTLNPYTQEAVLCGWTLIELSWYLQEHVGYSFETAVNLAVDLLRRPNTAASGSHHGSSSLVVLCAAWQDIPDACRNSVHLQRKRFATRTPDFLDQPHRSFSVENCTDAEQSVILRSLVRLAQSIHREDRQAREIVWLVCRDFPSAIVVCTRADLLAYLPGVHRSDLREVGYQVFPAGSTARINQVVLQSSWKLTLRPEPFVPLLLRERPSAEGARELLDVIGLPPSPGIRGRTLQRIRNWFMESPKPGPRKETAKP